MRGDAFFTEVSKRPPFTKLHPQVAGFFKHYFAQEKAIQFGDRMVVNTHFPPYPSRAFDNLAEGFGLLGGTAQRHLYSVTWAVTNRCPFNCWHCYNAGRSQTDLDLGTLSRVAGELQDMGAVMVTLTGGEPLLRDDLEEIAGLLDERSCVIVGTTGAGLTPARARGLRERGVFGIGVSLDSADEAEHDRLRGRRGAFRSALNALQAARDNGLYPYIVCVATHDLLQPDRFMPFMRFAAGAGATEVHLLEPSASGKLKGRTDVMLAGAERQSVLDYQRQVAQRDDLPILSSYVYLESPEAFGCGAGLTHLYIDGSGEVCPCQFVPLSFGNIAHESLASVLERMKSRFRRPRTACVGRQLAGRITACEPPTSPQVSDRICSECLPEEHPEPRFFRIHAAAREEVGQNELESAYDSVHGDYDAFWLTEAAKPIHDLLDRLHCRGSERVFEAGCGTGYASVLLAGKTSSVLAADISEGMLLEARRRAAAVADKVSFVAEDALQILESSGPFDLVFSSWVLGYIPAKPFYAAASRGLGDGGRLAFVVHKENSPREPLEIFAEIVGRDPSVLRKRVAFDFPRDMDQVRSELSKARFSVDELWDGSIVFRYDTPQGVLEHLLKSGAGTAFYEAIDPNRRAALTDEFLRLLTERHKSGAPYEVIHEYVACIATRG